MTTPASDAVARYREGCRLLDARDWLGAERAFDEAIALDEHFRAAFSRKAKCQLLMIRKETGLLGPDGLPALIDLLKSTIDLPLDDSTKSIEDYKPEYDYSNLGMAYEESGLYEEADASILRYLEHCPDDVETVFQRGNVKWKQGKKQDAAFVYRGAIQIRPHFLEARNNLAEVLIALGSPAEAESLMLTALSDKEGEWLIKGEEQRWRLYDTLATAQLAMASASGDDVFFPMALANLDNAARLVEQQSGTPPAEADAIALCYLRRGACQAKLNHIQDARRNVWTAIRYATSNSEVALASRRTLYRLPRRSVDSYVIPLGPAGAGVAILSLAVLAFSADQMAKGSLNSAAFAIVAIAALGGVIVGICLPRLTSFKLGSTEATLSEQIVLTTIDPTEMAFTTPPRH